MSDAACKSYAEASLYVHVPFCAGLCDYCDFYSLDVYKYAQLRELFVERVIAEVGDRISELKIERIPTLYIGGGTPSSLGGHLLGKLLSSLLSLLPNRPTEITIEANPESLDVDLLRILQDTGLDQRDRISLGVQTLEAEARKAIGRKGRLDQVYRALEDWSSHGSTRLSADLMCGLPQQTEEGLCADIKTLGAAGADHISLYSLTLAEDTPLWSQRDHMPEIEQADALYICGRDALEHSGFPQYEVSNFAGSEAICAHNLRYWRMESWIAAGPSASATLVDDAGARAMRYTVASDLEAYLKGRLDQNVEQLTAKDLLIESLLMGFRTRWGPDSSLFMHRFGIKPIEAIPETLERWSSRGLLREDALALTPEGLLLLNRFLIDCMVELERLKLPAAH